MANPNKILPNGLALCPSCNNDSLKVSNEPDKFFWKCSNCEAEGVEVGNGNICEACGAFDETVSFAVERSSHNFLCVDCEMIEDEDEWDRD